VGVPALAAMPDGRLLVMEREVFKAKKNIGSYIYNKVYVVTPAKETEGQLLEKELLVSFTTKINLTARSFANYEGMCLGPRLADGRQVVVLICDSQNQYKGFLKDWLRTFVF
jgi:S-adenosylmethionine/arginine decarboxylase-like enzyme